MVTALNQIVRKNSTEHLFLSAGILPTQIEAAINEASGVMVDVLKNQLENGKALDLMSFFKGRKFEHDLLLGMMIKKYANRLNKYHGLNNNVSREIAENIIPSVITICS